MSQVIPAASGGFVSRAERSPPRVLASTQPAIGPGAYDVTRNPEVNPAPAPFHTSSERVLAGNFNTSAITPGPGAYGTLRSSGGGSLGGLPPGPASPFVSGVPRLPIDQDTKARVAVPGPGSYDTGNKWVKGGHRYRADGANAAALRVMRLAPRQPTAPSVPGRGESYGYEEEADGRLVLQSPPEKAHTGVGKDTVGPGSYELAGDVPFNRPVGTNWSSSKSSRRMHYGPPTPGVGSYNLADSGPRRHGAGLLVTIGGVEVVFGGTNGTSSFVSKAPRPLQKLPESSPGPGDYDNLADPTAAPPALRMSTSAVFGTTGARGGWEADPTKTRSAPTYWRNPGPGAYEDPRVSPPSRRVPGPLGAPAATPFSTTSPRFMPSETKVPGPGNYHPDAITSLEFDVFKRVTGSRPAGGFGGSTGRFSYNRGSSSPVRLVVPGVFSSGLTESSSSNPGPGHYEPKLSGGPKTARSGTSNLASRTGRFRPVTAPAAVPDLSDFDGVAPLKGDPARLGPGCYSPERPTGRPRYGYIPHKTAAFGTEGKRLNMELPSKPNPGPGRYGVVDPAALKPLTLPPQKTGFSTQSDRWGSGSGTYTPGPGAYEPGPGAPFVRKSFNVTYTGTGISQA